VKTAHRQALLLLNEIIMHSHIQPVPLSKAYRLINHGPTVLVSSRAGGVTDVMAAAWCCAVDFDPPKLSVVLDSSSFTRSLLEASGRFVVQVPTVDQVDLTRALGNTSMHDDPEKLVASKVNLFALPGNDDPCVSDCSAWLACRLLKEPRNHSEYDLLIGVVEAAYADDRAFRDGRWHFETADPKWRSLHHVAGGKFYAIGEAIGGE
jgi:flavin reductase (DIM6/NTAB) family NADH-FMN oxidoreductase RutF